jgi:hypothetical protein
VGAENPCRAGVLGGAVAGGGGRGAVAVRTGSVWPDGQQWDERAKGGVVERWWLPGQTVVVGVGPETHLRRMAQDLAEARPLRPLRVSATSIQAVAHAFAMLGLASTEGAETAMTAASRALGLRGAGGSEPGIWPGPACDYWNMRVRGRHALAWIPRAVAAGAVRFSVAAAGLRCDWFRMAQAGLRFQVQAAAVGQRPPSRHAGMALAGLSAADDGGHSYSLRWDGGRGSDRLWMGEVVAEPGSEHERPDDVAWFELATADGPAARVVFAPPPATSVGPAAPPWPNACGVLPGLAEPAGSGAGTWPQRRQGGRGGGCRGPGVGRRDAGPKPFVAGDPGQAHALIAPGSAAYVAASGPPRHTA